MICLDADACFHYAGNITKLSVTTLLLLPDLALLDQAPHNVANIAVEHFLNYFQSCYCISAMPSNTSTFRSGNQHHVQVKPLNLILHMLFNRGRHVCFSEWHQSNWSYHLFVG